MPSSAFSRPREIHPLTALLLSLWVVALLSKSVYLPVLIFGVVVSWAARSKANALFAVWASVPLFLVVWHSKGLPDALNASLSLTALILSIGGLLQLVNPLTLLQLLNAVRVPGSIAIIVPMVYRYTYYMASTIREVRAALIGRGVRGRFKLTFKMPVPLVVHAFRVSQLAAETLVVRSKGGSPRLPPPRPPGRSDVVLVLIATTLLVLTALW
ncbi:MAG: energy-coupling factor transporter transmembrane protein EcfT [Desulfurococcales archaeon]|nr:energy-coupling factor transporter transmembrane protein EcfT [Desulfurococcales archaeon]